MNAAIRDALNPGGFFLVVDHHALPGAPDAVTQQLHRMDATIARREILAAGFELVAESDLLASREDPRDVSVFDEAWRGRTDRFVWVFRKAG